MAVLERAQQGTEGERMALPLLVVVQLETKGGNSTQAMQRLTCLGLHNFGPLELGFQEQQQGNQMHLSHIMLEQ
jgi:hypothetical protein